MRFHILPYINHQPISAIEPSVLEQIRVSWVDIGYDLKNAI